MKVGSLFDGSGTAPLAAAMCGIEPVWASEIEPYPIKVTKARFPNMKHLGDITQINGAEIEPVDIICGGSPCQDLSVAGKQAGIHEGERSHLFFEMTRIIKQMREATYGNYPKYVIWENVPGAFSSNNGEDFLEVLRSFAEIAEDHVFIPRPAVRRGKQERLAWTASGEVVGDRWSIAWRTVDAQYWGVPQRRRRIYLVADFANGRAGEILFERKGVRWDSAPSGEAREGTADDAAGSAGGSCGVRCLNTVPDVVYAIQGNGIDRADTAGCNGCGWRENESYTLNTIDRQAVCFANRPFNAGDTSAVVKTLCAAETSKQPGITVCYDCRGNGDGQTAANLTGDHENRVTDYTNCVCFDKQAIGVYGENGVSSTLAQRDYKDPTDLVVQKKQRKYIVRRLTPLECCRLQGFPECWTDGVEGSDSAQYKMWGNGMALPNMLHVMRGIAVSNRNRAADKPTDPHSVCPCD